jgi:hypothetical protein
MYVVLSNTDQRRAVRWSPASHCGGPGKLPVQGRAMAQAVS